MHNHEPVECACPFCRLANGQVVSSSSEDDVVYRDAKARAFIASKWWPNSWGHVLVVPNRHYENICDVPLELRVSIQRVTRKVAGSGDMSTPEDR